MAGNETTSFPVKLETEGLNTRSYGFTLPNEDKLLALWNDGVAADYDPGTPSTIVLSSRAGQMVKCIDVLCGFEQDLEVTTEGDNLVINGLLVRDYSIIPQLSDDRSS